MWLDSKIINCLILLLDETPRFSHIYLKSTMTDTERVGERVGGFPCAGSLHKCPRQPVLSQAKASSIVMIPHRTSRSPRTWGILCLLRHTEELAHRQSSSNKLESFPSYSNPKYTPQWAFSFLIFWYQIILSMQAWHKKTKGTIWGVTRWSQAGWATLKLQGESQSLYTQ